MKTKLIMNDNKFKELVNDIKNEWESFDKNLIIVCTEFDPNFAGLLHKHNFKIVDEDTFVSNLLDVNRTQSVDDFTDGGLCVFDYVAGELFTLGNNPYEHYAEILCMAVQYK